MVNRTDRYFCLCGADILVGRQKRNKPYSLLGTVLGRGPDTGKSSMGLT